MSMATLQKKSIKEPDEIRNFPNGKIALINIGEATLGIATFEPGWRWSQDVKPIAKTESCQMKHSGYQISGRLHVKMDDNTEEEFGPGDFAVIPPGHDAWVVGDENVVTIDVTGMTNYAKTD